MHWDVTYDCESPAVMAAFWGPALGYVEPPPPDGFATWGDWLLHHDVPEEEWDDGAYLADPAGVLPTISFLKVPEGKTAKNRLHMDLKVSGGRSKPQEVREPLIRAAVDRFLAAGATVLRENLMYDKLDGVVMADPEGNEFCVA